MSNNRPLRALQVVDHMDRAGTETWLMNVLRNTERKRFEIDFLVHRDAVGDYDTEILRHGARIIRCLNPRNPLQYGRTFLGLMKRFGPYDIVHSHVEHYSGFIMWLADRAGIPVRIAHSHGDTRLIQKRAGWGRRLYFKGMRKWILGHATELLAASREAAGALFGQQWPRDPRCRVLYCGIDLKSFRLQPDERIRTSLGIPPGARVIGHVGRFVEPKNHFFLISIARELVKLAPDTHFLLVGGGPLRNQVESGVRSAGLGARFTFAGVRSDVSSLMLGAMDAFVFPSLYEGLGLALVEAQAAGLPCFISSDIPEEAGVVPGLVHRIDLACGARSWAEQIARAAVPDVAQRRKALQMVVRSPFNITRSVAQLTELYTAGYFRNMMTPSWASEPLTSWNRS